MKKQFFKKLKKYTFVFFTLISCLVILSLPVSADSNLNYYLDNGLLLLEGTSFGIPGLNGTSTTGAVISPTRSVNDLSEDYEVIESSSVNFYRNAEFISDRLAFYTSSNSILLKKGSYFDSVIYGFSSSWIVESSISPSTLGFIHVTSDVNLSMYLYFREVGKSEYTAVSITDFYYTSENGGYLRFNCPYVPFDCDSFIISLLYKTNDNALIDVRARMPLSWFISQGRVVSHQFSFIDLNISFNVTVPPLSEQPIYSNPSEGSINDLDNIESQLVGSTNSAAEQELNKTFTGGLNFLSFFAAPLSAFRSAVNYFFDIVHNPKAYYIALISLSFGIILLFSNLVPRGRGKGD